MFIRRKLVGYELRVMSCDVMLCQHSASATTADGGLYHRLNVTP